MENPAEFDGLNYVDGFQQGYRTAVEQFLRVRFAAFSLEELERIQELIQFASGMEEIWDQICDEIERKKEILESENRKTTNEHP